MKINIKDFEFGKKIKNMNSKDIHLLTSIMYFAIVLLYELFYCNFNFFIGEITNYNFSIYRLIVYGIIYLIYYKFKDKFIEEAVNALNSKFKCYFIDIIIFLTILLSVSFLIVAVRNLNVNIVIAFISLLIFNLFAIYVSNNIVKNVVVTSILFGSIFSISITFNNQLDEKRHFLSSYSIAIGEFNLKSAAVDKTILDMPRMMKTEQFIKYFEQKPSGEVITDFLNKKTEDTPNTYMVPSYLVSSVGIFISRLLGGSVADIYITGRIFNLLAYVVLIRLVLKLLPYKKYIFYTMFFMPMLLALSSVYSPDGVGTASIAIFIAYCLRMQEKENINIKELSVLLLLLILACSVKSVGYIGVALIVLILPLRKIIKQNKKYIKYIIPLFAIILFLVLLIYKANINAPGDLRTSGTDTKEQFTYVINNPIKYSEVLVNHTISTFTSLKGMSFLNAPMFFSTTYYKLFLVMAIYLAFISITDSSKHLKISNRILFIITFFIVFAMTSTAMYLSYTKVGANYINGHQMRYIFPTLPLILISISIKKIELENKFKYSDLYIAYPMAIFLIVSVLDAIII